MPARRAPTARAPWYGVLLAALCLHALPPAASAQQADERRYTFAFVGVPLEQALDALLDAGGIDLMYASDVVAGQTSHCRARALRAEAVLACVLRDTEVDYVRLSSGTFVLVRRALVERLTSLRGRVVDAESGLPLPGAHVVVAGGAGTVTNADGRFVLAALPPGVHRVRVSHVAYRSQARTTTASEGVHLDVALTPRTYHSAPVVVSDAAHPAPAPLEAVDPRAARDAAPTPDLVRALAGVPGVYVGAGLADVHVQGGGAGAQLTRLDGVPIFMPVVHGGLVGPFSPFAAARVTVHKAGFGAAHGSGLAGVVDIEQAPGREAGRRFVARVDPLSANVRWGDRATHGAVEARWMVALRRGLWDLYEPERLQRVFRAWAQPDPLVRQLLAADTPVPATTPGDGRLEVGFDDAHLAALVRLGPLRTLRASAYHGTGRFGIDDPPADAARDDDAFEDAYRWTNRSARLGYAWVAGPRLLARVDGWASSYRLVHPAGLDAPTRTSNRLAQAGLQAAVDVAVAPRYLFSGGVEATAASSAFTLPLDPLGARPASQSAIDPAATMVALWAEQRVPAGAAAATLGLRVSWMPETGRAFAEPRLALDGGDPGARWRWRLAGGLYRQYVHAFDVATYNVTALLPEVRLWMPVGARQRPPLAYHAAASVHRRLSERLGLDAEVYGKRQAHALVLDHGAPDVSRPMRSASGWGAGGGLALRYAAPRAEARLAYGLDAGRRRIANRFGGRALPLPWSAPHRLRAALDVQPGRGLAASVQWHWAQGRSWGFRRAYYDGLVPAGVERIGSHDLAHPETHRLPPVHRLDASLSWTRTVGAAEVQLGVRVENMLGRRNVQDWWLEAADDGSVTRHARLAPGRLPSVWLRGRL